MWYYKYVKKRGVAERAIKQWLATTKTLVGH